MVTNRVKTAFLGVASQKIYGFHAFFTDFDKNKRTIEHAYNQPTFNKERLYHQGIKSMEGKIVHLPCCHPLFLVRV